MPVGLSVHFDSQPLDDSLTGLEIYLHDRGPARARIAADLEQTIQGYFDAEAGPEGAWEPLAALTLTEKRRKGYDMRILHRTLALRNGITVAASNSGDIGIIEAASDLDYAATMHFGDIREVFNSGATAVIPARPYLDITVRKEEQYDSIYMNQLEQAWNAVGFNLF